jgi:hypothetical protein
VELHYTSLCAHSQEHRLAVLWDSRLRPNPAGLSSFLNLTGHTMVHFLATQVSSEISGIKYIFRTMLCTSQCCEHECSLYISSQGSYFLILPWTNRSFGMLSSCPWVIQGQKQDRKLLCRKIVAYTNYTNTKRQVWRVQGIQSKK